MVPASLGGLGNCTNEFLGCPSGVDRLGKIGKEIWKFLSSNFSCHVFNVGFGKGIGFLDEPNRKGEISLGP